MGLGPAGEGGSTPVANSPGLRSSTAGGSAKRNAKKMKYILLITTALSLLLSAAALGQEALRPSELAQGAGIEWNILNQEAMSLYQQGQYDRAVVVAKNALEVAERIVGPDHPDVATSLENMAALYRAINRRREAAKLEERAVAIRAINR